VARCTLCSDLPVPVLADRGIEAAIVSAAVAGAAPGLVLVALAGGAGALALGPGPRALRAPSGRRDRGANRRRWLPGRGRGRSAMRYGRTCIDNNAPEHPKTQRQEKVKAS
jgi:hypothetical protein